VYRLIKIKELSGYRFFQDFKWDEGNCALFSRYNIVYGWNGSGKTTLCDFLKELEIGILSDAGTKTSLLFEDTSSKNNTTITHNKLNTIPYSVRVYHNRYIQDTISEVDKVKHIFAVGAEQKEKIEELKQLKAKLKSEEAICKRLSGEMLSLEASFEQLKTSKASLIKNAADYTGAYTKNKFYPAYQALTSPQLLSEKEHRQALGAIRAEKKAEIPVPIYNFILPSVKDTISPILEETPTNVTIDMLKNDSKLNDWVEQGLSLHEGKETTICQFCGEEIPGIRLDALRAHFNKSYKELSNKIDESINLLTQKSQQFVDAVASLPNSVLFYAELKDSVDELLDKIKALSSQNRVVISETIKILADKKSDMISTSYTALFEETINRLNYDYSSFDGLLNVITTHNQKTKEFQKSIEDAQKKIENHMLSEAAPEIIAAEKTISQKKAEVDKQNSIFTSMKARIDKLERQVKNSQITAEAINKDIAFIMGRDELVFENKSLGYQISRKGKIAKNLSKGEENAIALIYFFNTLTDVDVDIQNTIIILDDPISSFDSNFYYNAIAYIREKTRFAGQVFLFTHKFSLLKDYSLMYNSESNRYMIKRVGDVPVLVNEDNLVSQYHDEYAYLFKQVYNFVKKEPESISDYLQYPNIARRLLEGFLTFKMPNKDTLIDKVLKLEDDRNSAAGRAMLRLLNNHSHLRVITDGELSEDVANLSILPDTLRFLLEFIKTHDEIHFNVLVSQCEPANTSGIDILAAEKEKETFVIKLYDLPVSAGFGNNMEEDEPYEDFETSNPEADFAVKVSGNSMEPDIPDNSILLIKKSEEIGQAKVGIFFFDGNSYCKKKVETDDGLLLVSNNRKYPPIKVSESSDFRIFGEVVEVISVY